jgi:uncharacterized membrane protein YccC
MRWPSLSDYVFSVKTFIAAMLALYIALAINLDRPYWAMATVYVVSQPLIGSLRSRALYRLLGSVIGAVATVVLVPNLVNEPAWLCVAMALWTGVCLYMALLDRTPRSYVFLLAGYTAALIGFPAVTAPETIWDIAVARVEEVWLGIICVTIVGAVVFPRPLAPVVSARILAWVGNASLWAEEVLGPADESLGPVIRNRLAADTVELRMLTSQLAYDTSKDQAATRWVSEVERRMLLLLPLLSSIGDRIRALRAGNGVTAALEGVLAELRVWVRAGNPPPRSEATRLRTAIAALEQADDPRPEQDDVWNVLIRTSLLLRLRQLIDVRQDMRDLRRHIEAGGGPLTTPLSIQIDGRDQLHIDWGLAWLSGLAASATILVLCAFWIETGWQGGVGMVQLAAVACCLFASLDDPTPALMRFLIIALVAVVAVGIGLFAILPMANNFEMLTLALGAFFLPVGVLGAIPATQPIGTALGFLTATLLSLQSTYAADFISYADGSIAILLGLSGAAIMTALMRSVGAEWSARRLLRADWRDIAAIPHGRVRRGREELAALLLDRIGLLVPKLAAIEPGHELAGADALADLRVGINMMELQHHHATLPSPVREVVDGVLFAVATQYAVQAELGHARPPPPVLLEQIDRALDAALATEDARARHLLPQLVGIRRGLFAGAGPYRGVTPPTELAREDVSPTDEAPLPGPSGATESRDAP